jgi:GDP-mannose 6-dehydrogenase
MRISIFGLGYVGCVTAACLARTGHEVFGVDVNPDKVAMINAGKSPIVEPGLSELIAEMVKTHHLRASVSVDQAIKHSDVAMICVGTPSGRNGQIDTSAIECVMQDIARAIERRTDHFRIIVRSTLLPGTTENVLMPILRTWLGANFDDKVSIAVNPEFMREGTSLADFDNPPMTLVGCADDDTANVVRRLYGGIEAPFIHTAIKVAEMTKYVSNTFHALKICFANEIGDLCESLGVDPHEVTRTFLADHKLNISEAYLRPGFAFGGSCLPKDLRALMHIARRSDVKVPLLASIDPSNDQQIQRGIQSVLGTGKKRIGVVGLAFKAGTDDLRESPIVTLVETLIGKGCSLRILDPNVRLASLIGANRRYIETEIPHIASLMCDDISTLVDHAEVLVIGSNGPDAKRAIAMRRPGQMLVDLTRGLPVSPAHTKPVGPSKILVATNHAPLATVNA